MSLRPRLLATKGLQVVVGGQGGDVLSPSGVSGTSAYRAAHSGGLKAHVPALSDAGQ